jgi:hypothetical protein
VGFEFSIASGIDVFAESEMPDRCAVDVVTCNLAKHFIAREGDFAANMRQTSVRRHEG